MSSPRWNSPEARAAARERSRAHQERRRDNAAKVGGRLDLLVAAAYGPAPVDVEESS